MELLLDINLVLLTTAAFRISLWTVAAIFAYRRRRLIGTAAFGFTIANSVVFGYQRSGGDLNPGIVSVFDATSTIAAGLIVLAYIMADPDERPKWLPGNPRNGGRG